MTEGNGGSAPVVVPVIVPVARLGRHRLFVVGVERWPSWFEVRWALVPGAARLVPSKLWAFSYEWTASDDRGAAYSRDGGSGGGGPLLLSGTQRFAPALHDDARSLAVELREPSGVLAASATVPLAGMAGAVPPDSTGPCPSCGRAAAAADPSACATCARLVERVLDALAADTEDEPRRLVVVDAGITVAGLRLHAVELWRRFAIVHATAPARLGFGTRPPSAITTTDDRGAVGRGSLHRTDTAHGVHHHMWLVQPPPHPGSSTLAVEAEGSRATVGLAG